VHRESEESVVFWFLGEKSDLVGEQLVAKGSEVAEVGAEAELRESVCFLDEEGRVLGAEKDFVGNRLQEVACMLAVC